jgi:uncharacterized protein (DUF1697 family)
LPSDAEGGSIDDRTVHCERASCASSLEIEMPRFVALFRGINVGKAKRVAMADLRALLQKLGYTEVATLLNSGNAVFTAPAGSSLKLAQRIRAEVAKELGVDALVIVKSARDVAAIIADNLLSQVATDHSRLLVAMANETASITALGKFTAAKWGDERVHVGKHAAYLWCAHGILESKAAAALLKELAELGTTRNWATLQKIHALMEDGR